MARDPLSDVLVDLARTLVADVPVQEILDHLVRRVVDILPVDAAGVSLVPRGAQPRRVAGSDESANRYEELQTRLGEGPCVAAHHERVAIALPDLAREERFPVFAAHALDEGLAAVFSLPLHHDDRCLGALDLYRTSPGRLTPAQMSVAQTLADVATAYLLRAQAQVERSEFVAALSHELRTPMTSIVGSVELLLDDEDGGLTPSQLGFLRAIGHNSDRLLVLTDSLLELSGLDPVSGSHLPVDVDLGRVVAQVRDAMSPMIDRRDLAVTFELPPEPVVLLGDVDHLESMVSNLISNALKFTPDGGWVTCTLQAVDDVAVLVVGDNGLGIPAAEQAELFTRFYRSTVARERAIQGSGLGLSIVAAVVHDHGGQVAVVSEHLEGATFTVTLPLGTSSPAAPRRTSRRSTP